MFGEREIELTSFFSQVFRSSKNQEVQTGRYFFCTDNVQETPKSGLFSIALSAVYFMIYAVVTQRIKDFQAVTILNQYLETGI